MIRKNPIAKHIFPVLSLLFIAVPWQAGWAGEILQAIHDNDEIRLGFRSSSVPFSVVDETGVPHGYSIELCMHVADTIRQRLGKPKLSIKWVPVTAESRIANVRYGQVHIECGSTTNTIARQAEVDFSYPIYITGSRLLVRKGEDINWFKDLDGKIVAVIKDTTTERVVKNAIKRLSLNTQFGFVDDHAAGFQVVAEGQADAYISDDILLYGLIKASPTPEAFEVVGDFLSYEPYGLMLSRDDPDLRGLVNATLARLFRSGQIERIHARWFDELDAPMPDLLRASFIINGLPD